MSGGEKVEGNRCDIGRGLRARLRALRGAGSSLRTTKAVAYAPQNLRECLRAGLRGPFFAPHQSSDLRAGFGPKEIRRLSLFRPPCSKLSLEVEDHAPGRQAAAEARLQSRIQARICIHVMKRLQYDLLT